MKSYKAPKVRSYSDIITRINTMDHLTISTFGSIRESPSTKNDTDKYTIFKLSTKKNNKPKIFISGGVHGDEPAGAYAALEFFQNHVQEYVDHFQFLGAPLLNPWGYERDLHNDCDGYDINRMFTPQATLGLKPLPQQVYLLKPGLEGEHFRCAWDLHEDYPGWKEKGVTVEEDVELGYYLYETQWDENKRIGRQIVDEVLKHVEPYKGADTRYGDKITKGLITYPDDCANVQYSKGTSLDAYLNQNHTNQTYTSETPTTWPMEKRVNAHITALRACLDILRE